MEHHHVYVSKTPSISGSSPFTPTLVDPSLQPDRVRCSMSWWSQCCWWKDKPNGHFLIKHSESVKKEGWDLTFLRIPFCKNTKQLPNFGCPVHPLVADQRLSKVSISVNWNQGRILLFPCVCLYKVFFSNEKSITSGIYGFLILFGSWTTNPMFYCRLPSRSIKNSPKTIDVFFGSK